MADKITSKDLALKKDNFILIDIRERDEVVEDRTIKGAKNIPLGELIRNARQGNLDDLEDKEIVTYCNGGYRGNIGADELVKKGFKATTIDGGYAAWQETQKMKIPDSPFSDTNSKSARYYDRNAQSYTETNQKPAEYIDEYLEMLGSDKKILDLGSGSGVNAAYMHSKKFHVVGIDLSKSMVELARSRYPKIEFMLGDMTKLSFPKSSFDGILASYSLILLFT